MIDLVLAASGSNGDWIQFLVVIVVIGISLLGQLSKVLIQKFSPEKPEQRRPDAVAPRSAPPPAVRGSTRPSIAPPARPRVPRPTIAPPVRPVAQRPAAPPMARPKPASPRSFSTPKRPPVAQPVPMDEPTIQRRHLAQIASALEKESEVVDAEVSEHLSQVEGDLVPEIVETAVVAPHAPFERLSRAALRRAIVLSEVLAPPLALRASRDRL